MYLSYHSFSKFILYGWGYNTTRQTDKEQLHPMGTVAAQAMQNVNGETYQVGTFAELLPYNAGSFNSCSREHIRNIHTLVRILLTMP